MKIAVKTAFFCWTLVFLNSCVKEPKAKQETIQSANDYEKVIDSIVGVETIDPEAIKVGDKDTMVESMKIANSFVREKFRREILVTDIEKKDNQIQYKFQVRSIQRDAEGNPQEPVTTVRTLILAVSEDGYYQFFGDGDSYTVFSWDFLVGLRGFCSNFQNEESFVTMTCSSIQLEAATYGPLAIPVKKLSLNRAFEIRNKKTGSVDKGKLRYVIQIAPQIQEISKVVSFCVEGLQKFDNSVYQLVNCNNVESL
jgi:hypothetical protein